MKTNLTVISCRSFLLWLLFFCLIEGAGSLPWTGGSAAKPGKPKGKKKLSSVRQKFDVGCSSVDLGNDWFKNCCDGTDFSFLMNITILVGKLKKTEEKKMLFGEEKMLLNLKLGLNLWHSLYQSIWIFILLVCYCIIINMFSLVYNDFSVIQELYLCSFPSKISLGMNNVTQIEDFCSKGPGGLEASSRILVMPW